MTNRRAAIGYGKKLDFTKTAFETPAANNYQHKSVFEESKNHGKTFGGGRSPDRSYLIPQKSKVPGPGQVVLETNIVLK